MYEFQNQLQNLNVDDFQVTQPVPWEQNQYNLDDSSRQFMVWAVALVVLAVSCASVALVAAVAVDAVDAVVDADVAEGASVVADVAAVKRFRFSKEKSLRCSRDFSFWH